MGYTTQNDRYDGDDLEQRLETLSLEALHRTAHIIACTDKDKVDEHKESLQTAMERIGMLTGREPEEVEEMMKAIGELCEMQKELIEEDLVEERLAAEIIMLVKKEEEFQAIMAQAQEDAQEQAAEEMDGQSRDGEQQGGETKGDPSGKVDPDVLDGLSTTYSAN